MIIANVEWIGPLEMPSSFICSCIGRTPRLSIIIIKVIAIARPINNQGLMMLTMMLTNKALKKPCVHQMIMNGSIKSRTAKSLENRVTILPIGFLSKNKIFARRTFSITALCIFVVALVQILKTMRALTKLITINAKTEPIN